MRWLMIALLVSVGALLIASGGVAHHIWRARTERQRKRAESMKIVPDRTEAADVETEEAL
jgi:hypothetical protein